MPGTTFLPIAGTVGTLVAMFLGAAVLVLIAANFHKMMNRPALSESDAHTGGVFEYTKKVFGYDHSLMCVWSIALAYVSILWANMTAFPLIIRYLFGPVLQWGFSYTFAGFQVWAGEILVSVLVVLVCGFLSAKFARFTRLLQTILAAVLFFGVVSCFFFAFSKVGFDFSSFAPEFSPIGKNASRPLLQILNIVALAPWAFIGFCVVSLLPGKSEFSDGSFPRKKSFLLMAAAIFCGMLVYVLLTLLSTLNLPEDCGTWVDYISHLSDYGGRSGIPTFHAVETLLGRGGFVFLGVCVCAAILTGILGMYRAASRLLQSMAEDDVLPAWFGRLSENGLPRNATVFIMLLSVLIPFFGRTAIGWIVDITTICAAISYAYISAASFVVSRREGDGIFMFTGAAGFVASIFFCFPILPTPWNPLSLERESYFILAAWGMVGLVLFRIVFIRDAKNRFGKSTVMWIAMLFIVLVSSTMWQRQMTYDETEEIITNISNFHKNTHVEEGIPMTEFQIEREEDFMENQMDTVRDSQFTNSIVQFTLIFASLAIMLNIFTTQKKREQKLDAEKSLAEEASKAKSVFLSNMSHDIRTPMNAIIGYITLAKREGTTIEQMREFLGKVEGSSQHLLALINDVLEMSRIESGKMELEEVPCDLKKLMDGVRDMFSTQMSQKNIVYTVTTTNIRNRNVLCDKNRLNRVLLNLISNAYKFTPDGGSVYVSLEEKNSLAAQSRNSENAKFGKNSDFDTLNQRDDSADSEKVAHFELRVRDSGIGMSPEFAEKVFEAFERERTSTVSGIQGTGLGTAITKSIVDLMGGDIRVQTALGEGSEFIVNVAFRVAENGATESENQKSAEFEKISESDSPQIPENSETGEKAAPNFSEMRLLLVDDVEINREIAEAILEDFGFSVEIAENGKEAVEKVECAEAGHFDAVLMDIQMPVMDGYEATAKIRALSDEKKARIPIVAMTANAFSEDIQKARDSGMDGHIAKPVDIGALTKTLAEVLRR